MNDWLTGVYPDVRPVFASLQDDLTGFEPQALRERCGSGEGIGGELDADPPEFEELAVFAPRIRFCDQQDNIAVLFRPDIQRQVTVAQWHRIIFIGAKSIPSDITRGRERVFGRAQHRRSKQQQGSDND